MKNIIIASTSTLHGGDYLEYILKDLTSFFKNTKTILFIPYARPSGISHDDYTKKVSKAFSKIDKKVIGIHTLENPVEAVSGKRESTKMYPARMGSADRTTGVLRHSPRKTTDSPAMIPSDSGPAGSNHSGTITRIGNRHPWPSAQVGRTSARPSERGPRNNPRT